MNGVRRNVNNNNTNTNTNTLYFVLGAADPEMEAIESILDEVGIPWSYATVADYGGPGAWCAVCGDVPDPETLGLGMEDQEVWGGLGGCGDLHHWVRRVRPGEAYGGLPVHGLETVTTIIMVECEVPLSVAHQRVIIADHHREGDRGFGRPPAEYLSASSIGQVLEILAEYGLLPKHWPDWPADLNQADVAWTDRKVAVGGKIVPPEILLIAAADHSLSAAYQGCCPGVDPQALATWRAESRAKFQGRSVGEVLADIHKTQNTLRSAPTLSFGTCDDREVTVADMRRETPHPELPEAAAREGASYVSGPLIGPDGRHKYTCSGSPEVVEAFLRQWGPSQGLTGLYGDPARGFAGGYR